MCAVCVCERMIVCVFIVPVTHKPNYEHEHTQNRVLSPGRSVSPNRSPRRSARAKGEETKEEVKEETKEPVIEPSLALTKVLILCVVQNNKAATQNKHTNTGGGCGRWQACVGVD